MFCPKPPRRLSTFSTPALLLLTLAGLVWSFAHVRGVSAAGSLPPITFTVTNAKDTVAGSLRQAILDANTTPGPDTITFNISGAGLHTITPATPLPPITDPVLIDGYTQPGASANTVMVGGSNAVLLIELNGMNAGAQADGLLINGNTTTVRGLVINRFAGNGILLNAGAEGTVAGCYIGTNDTGTAALGNAAHGVAIIDSGSHTIGGPAASDSN